MQFIQKGQSCFNNQCNLLNFKKAGHFNKYKEKKFNIQRRSVQGHLYKTS